MTKNYMTDLRDHMFAGIEWITDRDIKGEELKEEVFRQMALNEMAKTTIALNALMAKCADTLYGLPVADELHIIPPSPSENPVIVSDDRKSPLSIPKGKQ